MQHFKKNTFKYAFSKYVLANQALFINKTNKIMNRSRLRNKFLNNNIDRKAHTKQRNLCVSLIRQVKK